MKGLAKQDWRTQTSNWISRRGEERKCIALKETGISCKRYGSQWTKV